MRDVIRIRALNTLWQKMLLYLHPHNFLYLYILADYHFIISIISDLYKAIAT